MGNLTGWHALIILAVVILIFGAAKLPALAKSVGQSVKILKREVQPEPSIPSPLTPGTLTQTSTPTPTPTPTTPAAADPDGQALRHI